MRCKLIGESYMNLILFIDRLLGASDTRSHRISNTHSDRIHRTYVRIVDIHSQLLC